MSMNETNNKSVIWGWAAAAGVLAFVIFKFLMSYAFWPALFLAILIAILVAILVWIAFFRGETGSLSDDLRASSATASTTTAAPAATAPAPAAKPAAKPAPAAKPKPAAKAAAKPAAKPAAKAAAKPAAKPVEKAAGSAAVASDMMGDAGKSLKQDAAVDYDGDGVVEGADEGTKPAALDGPRSGGADDLKKIKGVGPKLEKLLNSMGFYHFDQIAGWSADEIAWVNANLAGFKGRATRDNWIEQAATLAAGGDTAFSKKVDKGGVY